MSKYFLTLLIVSTPFNLLNASENFKSFDEYNADIKLFLESSDPEVLKSIKHVNLRRVTSNGPLFKWQYPYEMTPSEITGYTHAPNTRVRHIEKMPQQLVYDATYTFDKYSRRVNPIPITPKHRKYIAIYGCSYTYGNGLNDNQTIHYHLTHQSKSTYAYNYAIGASGPNLLLALLQSPTFNLYEQIPIKDGKLIYIYNDFHIGRVNAFLNESSWMGKTPFFKKINGKMTNLGSIEKNSSLLFSLYKPLQKLYSFFGVNKNFPKHRKKHDEYLCDIVAEARTTYEQKYPGSKFYTYIHPDSRLSNNIKNCFNKNKINYLKSKIKIDSEIHKIKYDGHPTGALNQLIAKEILNHFNE